MVSLHGKVIVFIASQMFLLPLRLTFITKFPNMFQELSSFSSILSTISGACYDMQKNLPDINVCFFLSYVTLNCYVTFWTGYVITSDYSRVSSRVTRQKHFYNKRVAIALLLFR